MRPALHFTPSTGWINDPHGIIRRDGGYHAFFQYVPGRTDWALSCHWGHASGPELLSLTEHAVAIAPGEGDDGIWTGCVVQDGDDTVAFYTSVAAETLDIGRVRAAVADDASLGTWRKTDVVVDPPAGLDLVAFRDPYVRREGAAWRMFVGGAHRDGTAMALSWTSSDLRAWSYDGVVLARSTAETDPVWMGELWECPQFFRVDGVDVMVSSVWDRARGPQYGAYAFGSYAGGRFDADGWGRLMYGDGYAPSYFVDGEGMPWLQFWIRGVADRDAGWAGALSVPYRMRFVDGALVGAPHPDVDARRGPLAADGRVAGLAADIDWDASTGDLVVESGGAAVVRVTRSPESAMVAVGEETWTLPASGTLRAILDGPVLEVSSPSGLFATAVSPAGYDLAVRVSAGRVRVHRLA